MLHIDHEDVVRAQITVAGAVRLDGRCEGAIYCWRLEVGRWGRIEGEVEAEEVVVEGEVIGDIRARRVWLHASAVVEGDVTHASLVVDGAAVLVGDSHHDSESGAPASVQRLRLRVASEDRELACIERAAMEAMSIGVARAAPAPPVGFD